MQGCPEGKLCNNGMIAGSCGPGTYCPVNASSALPTPPGVFDSNGIPYACPSGSYCPGETLWQCPRVVVRSLGESSVLFFASHVQGG